MAEHVRTEYGVIVDRRSDGLGLYLACTTESEAIAEMRAEMQDPKYPVEIMRRTVTRTDWESLPEPPARPDAAAVAGGGECACPSGECHAAGAPGCYFGPAPAEPVTEAQGGAE